LATPVLKVQEFFYVISKAAASIDQTTAYAEIIYTLDLDLCSSVSNRGTAKAV
jgi:hypothetical protein